MHCATSKILDLL